MRATLAAALILYGGPATAAERPRDVTIVFNVDMKAFVCWYESDQGGALQPASPTAVEGAPLGCPFANAYPFLDNVHFYRGQKISLRLVGARAVDSFSVDITTEDLTVPGVPVFGGVTELPSLLEIQPATNLVLPPGFVQASSGRRDIASQVLYPEIDKAAAKDFEAYLTGIIARSELPELKTLVDDSVGVAIARLSALLSPQSEVRTGLSALATALQTPLVKLDRLRTTYCSVDGAPRTTPDADFTDLLLQSRTLRNLIERQRILYSQMQASGLNAAATQFAALRAVARHDKVAAALDIDLGSPPGDPHQGFGNFLSRFSATFPAPNTMTWIDRVALSGGHYVLPGAQGDFLAGVNMFAVDPQLPPKAANLQALKANLRVIARLLPNLRVAAARLGAAQKAEEDLNTYLTAASTQATVQTYNRELNELNVRLIEAADDANCTANNMHLPDALSTVLSDAWHDSKQVRLTLKRNTRLAMFDTSALSRAGLADPRDAVAAAPRAAEPAAKAATEAEPAKAAAPAGGAAPAPAAPAAGAAAAKTAAPSADPTTIGTGQFRVRNLYHFQVGLGFIYSRFDDVAYTLVKQTKKVGDVEEVVQMFVQSRDRDYRFQPSVDLLLYPGARDFFPRSRRHPGEKPPFRSNIAGLVGFSMTNPTRDFYFGAAYLPDSGIGIKGGLHLGFVDTLPDGVEANEALTVPVVAKQVLRRGLFVGVEMNAGLFRDVFGVIFKK